MSAGVLSLGDPFSKRSITLRSVGAGEIGFLAEDSRSARICGVEVSPGDFWAHYGAMYAAAMADQGESFCEWFKASRL